MGNPARHARAKATSTGSSNERRGGRRVGNSARRGRAKPPREPGIARKACRGLPELTVKRHRKLTPWRHENCPPRLDQWHGADGVIHALSTVPVPSKQKARWARVGNPARHARAKATSTGSSNERRGGRRVGNSARRGRAKPPREPGIARKACRGVPELTVKRHRKLTPWRHENCPPVLINGTALTGLSTLCPRCRSPANKRRGGQRVGNPARHARAKATSTGSSNERRGGRRVGNSARRGRAKPPQRPTHRTTRLQKTVPVVVRFQETPDGVVHV